MKNSKEKITIEFCKLVNHLFQCPEIESVKVRDVRIERNDNKINRINEAIDKSYHDEYSDMDVSIVVKLSAEGKISKIKYMEQKERFGFSSDNYLGIVFVPENKMYRIILKNGIRYDFGFEFIEDSSASMLNISLCQEQYSNKDLPITDVDRFWFVQIQALGKLYRKDYLISDHLANMNINETLVQQMVMRDIKYKTNHHRYGYCEQLTYLKNKGGCPFKKKDETFNMIADKLYCAALAYDELTRFFYPKHESRSKIFFDIWEDYVD